MQDWSQFFDPNKARGPTDAPDVGRPGPACGARGDDDASAGPEGGALTVSALIARLKGAIADAFPARLTVVGELSNVKRHSSGHVYLSLKDAGSSIDAVIWRSRAGKLAFEPADGLEVVVEGRLDVYERRGSVQLYVERMTPRGEGALELALRQLREKLQREGLFDPARKKPLPRLPRAIGIVTSPTGAAIRDIRRTLLRRWPGARAYLVPARVQGDSAAQEVADALDALDRSAPRYEIDVLIVARGGGSLEDLWAFNEEPVARAVYAARTPVVSGVGHEVDVTICDLVADARAATPTAAAELVVPDAGELSAALAERLDRLRRRLVERVQAGRREMRGVLRSVVFRDPMWRVRGEAQHVDELAYRLGAAQQERFSADRRRVEPLAGRLASLHPARLVEQRRARVDRRVDRLRWALGARAKRGGDRLHALAARLAARHPRERLALAAQRVESLRRHLEAMSHRAVLARGFSVTRDARGRIVRSTGEVTPGLRVETELSDGRFASIVDDGQAGRDAQARDDGGFRRLDDAPPPRPRRRPRPRPADDEPMLFD